MSLSTFSTQRRMSVDVHPAHVVPLGRPACSPFPNAGVATSAEEPTLRKKSSFSFASLLPGKRPASRADNNHHHGTQSAPAELPSSSKTKPAKPAKKPVVDLAAVYGADFARAVAANQFLNGGSVEDAIARVKRDNEKMARRRAEKYGVPYVADATAPVRGPAGELFRDAQEESERRGLVRNAYKGADPRLAKGMRPEDAYATSATEDAAWAHFRASPAAAAATTRVSSTGSARADFFASSFAPTRQ